MNNKKGFTFVELLGAIAILAIVIAISSTTYINIRKNILNKQYENEISYIETKAVKYAEDTGITYVNVDTLIKEGYIDADDETDIYSPVDGKSLNCYYVNIKYENGEYVGKFDENSEKKTNEGTCDTFESSNLKVLECNTEGKECKNIDNKEWYKDNKLLKVVDVNSNELSNVKEIRWTTTTGYESKEKSIITSVSDGMAEIQNYTVEADYTNEEGIEVKGKSRATIRIDRQSPSINSIKIENENEWTNKDKKVEVTMTDFNGSGVKGIYVGNAEKCTEDLTYTEITTTNNTYTFEQDAGSFMVCIKDKVGNVGGKQMEDAYEIKINKIDKIVPTCKIEATKVPDGQNGWYISNVKLNMITNDEGGSGVSEYGIVQGTTTATYNGKNSIEHVTNTSSNGVTYYGYVKDLAGNEGKCELKLFVDLNNPTCTISANPANPDGQNGWYKSNVTLTLNPSDAESGIDSKGLVNSSSASYNGQTTATVSSNSSNMTYYGYVKDKSGRTGSCNKTIKIDNVAPSYSSKSGSMTSYLMPTANFNDNLSGVAKVEYYVSTSSSTPSGTVGWKTSQSYSSSCGNTYYAFARATDNAGNISSAKLLDAYYENCYTPPAPTPYCYGCACTGTCSYCTGCECTNSCGGVRYSSGTNGYGGNKSNGGKTTTTKNSTCDSDCYMKNNGSDWHDIMNSGLPSSVASALANALHNDSTSYNSSHNNYNYNSGSGSYSNSYGRTTVGESDNSRSNTSYSTGKTSGSGHTTTTVNTTNGATITHVDTGSSSSSFVKVTGGNTGNVKSQPSFYDEDGTCVQNC